MTTILDVEALKLHLQEVYHTHELSGYDYDYTLGFEEAIQEIETHFHLEGFVDFICGYVLQHHMDYFLQREPTDISHTPRKIWYTYMLTAEDIRLFPEFRFLKELTFTQDKPEICAVVEGFDDFSWYEEK